MTTPLRILAILAALLVGALLLAATPIRDLRLQGNADADGYGWWSLGLVTFGDSNIDEEVAVPDTLNKFRVGVDTNNQLLIVGTNGNILLRLSPQGSLDVGELLSQSGQYDEVTVNDLLLLGGPIEFGGTNIPAARQESRDALELGATNSVTFRTITSTTVGGDPLLMDGNAIEGWGRRINFEEGILEGGAWMHTGPIVFYGDSTNVAAWIAQTLTNLTLGPSNDVQFRSLRLAGVATNRHGDDITLITTESPASITWSILGQPYMALNQGAGLVLSVPLSFGGTNAESPRAQTLTNLGLKNATTHFLRPDTNSTLTWTNSTNWQTIPGLTWPAEIGAHYLVEGVIHAQESANGEWKFQIAGAILETPEMGWWLAGAADAARADFENWPVTPEGSVEAFKFRFLITATNTNIAVQIDVHLEDTNSVLEVFYSTWLTVQPLTP